MEATKTHALWETGSLHDSFEALLAAYEQSVGSCDGGVPTQLVDGACRIDARRVTLHAAGPANCTPNDPEHKGTEQPQETIVASAEDVSHALDEGAAVIDGAWTISLLSKLGMKS